MRGWDDEVFSDFWYRWLDGEKPGSPPNDFQRCAYAFLCEESKRRSGKLTNSHDIDVFLLSFRTASKNKHGASRQTFYRGVFSSVLLLRSLFLSFSSTDRTRLDRLRKSRLIRLPARNVIAIEMSFRRDLFHPITFITLDERRCKNKNDHNGVKINNPISVESRRVCCWTWATWQEIRLSQIDKSSWCRGRWNMPRDVFDFEWSVCGLNDWRQNPKKNTRRARSTTPQSSMSVWRVLIDLRGLGWREREQRFFSPYLTVRWFIDWLRNKRRQVAATDLILISRQLCLKNKCEQLCHTWHELRRRSLITNAIDWSSLQSVVASGIGGPDREWIPGLSGRQSGNHACYGQQIARNLSFNILRRTASSMSFPLVTGKINFQ